MGELQSTITLSDGKRITKEEAIVRQMANNAARGDIKSQKIEDGGPLDRALEKTGNTIKAGTRKVVGVAKSVTDYSQDSITKAKLKKREQELEIELLKKKIRKMEEKLKD